MEDLKFDPHPIPLPGIIPAPALPPIVNAAEAAAEAVDALHPIAVPLPNEIPTLLAEATSAVRVAVAVAATEPITVTLQPPLQPAVTLPPMTLPPALPPVTLPPMPQLPPVPQQQQQQQQGVQQQHSTTLTPTTTTTTPTPIIPSSGAISFEPIYHELQNYQILNNGTLAIPTSHPALDRITDALTTYGIEILVSQRWDDQLSQLRLFKSQHGNCNVPVQHPTLGKWVEDQREYYKLYEANPKSSPLSKSRFEILKSLGLTINRWEKRLEELREFKAQHGHCDVQLNYPHLGVWVLNQRESYHFSREQFPQDRVDALDELGFNWNRWGRNRLKIREDQWDAQFVQLLEYIKQHGHSNISQHDKEKDRLGKWIKNQRYEYRKYNNKGLGPSRLGRDRIDKLNSIGFQWRLRPEKIPWDDRFKLMVKFKETNGHCRVPMSVPELGKWAKYQRDQYVLFVRGKKAKITQEKIDKLLSIGFEESLEERVQLGLEGGLDEEGHEVVEQQEEPNTVVYQHQPHEEMAYQQHHAEQPQQQQQHEPQQAYTHVEEYHHGADPAQHPYGGAHQQPPPPPGPETFHYQHGSVHYHQNI